MNNLRSRLKSMGLIISPSEMDIKQKIQPLSLDTFFDGTWHKNKVGKVFIMKNTVPFDNNQGDIRFNNYFSIDPIFELSGIIPGNNIRISDIVFLDIETTSLSIGAGSFAFLIGLCFFSQKNVTSDLLFIEKPSNESALLALLDEKLSPFSVICTYNGKSFDMPLLKNRYIMHKMKFSSLSKNHLDLLYLTRKIWKMRLRTCKLSEIEKKILKFNRSGDDIPGWLIPQIYFDYLDQRSPSLLKGVFYHNRMDVLSLAALFQYINLFILNKGNMDNAEGKDLASIARIYQQQDKLELSSAYYKSGIKKGFSSESAAYIHRNFGIVNKKLGKWEEAIIQWKHAVEFGDYISSLELAKYFEHRARSYAQALDWTNQALKIINDESSKGSKTKIRYKLEHRKRRLIRKINKK